MELEFHYQHITRTFRKREVVVTEDSIFVEVNPTIDFRIGDRIQNAIRDAMRQIDAVFELGSGYNTPDFPFSPRGYAGKDKDISEGTHIWEKELGYPGTGDIIRVTSTFPEDVQKQFEKEWDLYMDYLSLPTV